MFDIMKTRHKENSSAGFSLVEITLALMVVGIGVLAVFGIISDSLRSNTRTLDDTIAATFAESVFNSIYAADWNETVYEPIMGNVFWGTSPQNTSSIKLGHTAGQPGISYKYEGIEYYPLKYDLRITSRKRVNGIKVGTNNDAVWRSIVLKVWIGKFANTGATSKPHVFYTEQYRFGLDAFKGNN